MAFLIYLITRESRRIIMTMGLRNFYFRTTTYVADRPTRRQLDFGAQPAKPANKGSLQQFISLLLFI